MAAAAFSFVLGAEEVSRADRCRTVLLGGETWRKVPASGSAKRIVVLGSSTANGAGASKLGLSWVGLLAESLQPAGVEVVNRSIDGSSTINSIERFNRDVVPLNPSVVVLATSFYNSRSLGVPSRAVSEYVEDSKRLVELVRGIGALPVLISPYAYEGNTERLLPEVLSLRTYLDLFGELIWDFWNPTALDDGRWIPGRNFDALHPNDEGHLALRRSISIEQLLQLMNHSSSAAESAASDIVRVKGEGSLQLSFTEPLLSWTISIRIHNQNASMSDVVYFTPNDGGEGVMVIGNVIRVGSESIELPPSGSSSNGRVIAVNYSPSRSVMNIYADGKWIRQMNSVNGYPVKTVDVKVKCEVCSLEEVLVHRAALSGEFADMMWNGTVPRASIDSWVRFQKREDGLGVPFQAIPGSSFIAAASPWTIDGTVCARE